MELYGNSVLDNTLHDRLGRAGGPARLQKSQSAVWSRTGSGRKRPHHKRAPCVSSALLFIGGAGIGIRALHVLN